MARWEVWPEELRDQQGDPRQFYGTEGEVFIITVKRISGPGDLIMPRRVVGMGSSRKQAWSNLHAALTVFDRGYLLDTTREPAQGPQRL